MGSLFGAAQHVLSPNMLKMQPYDGVLGAPLPPRHGHIYKQHVSLTCPAVSVGALVAWVDQTASSGFTHLNVEGESVLPISGGRNLITTNHKPRVK